MIEFEHSAPEGYSYEFENFKRNVIAVWIVSHFSFSYTTKTPKSIWGFFNTKTRQYHAPVNSKTVGKVVNFNSTTPYTAMQIKYNPLTAAFV
jgi:hypothetical protein